MTNPVTVGSLPRGTHIRWLVDPDTDYWRDGWVIGLHEESGFIRVAMEPESDKAHWTMVPGKVVEAIRC